MKTIKYLMLTLVLFAGSMALHASSDGTAIKESTATLIRDTRVLVPEIPLVATFESVEAEYKVIIRMEVARRFSPEIPMEAGFSEEIPDETDLSPVVPLEAPFTDSL